MKWISYRMAKWLYKLYVLLKYYLFHENILSTPGLLIETNSGQIQGISSFSRDGRPFYEWLGIPYAKPPVGNLRFASPEPVENWNGVRDGSRYGGICAQMDILVLAGVLQGSEDCLYLNVYAPMIGRSRKRLRLRKGLLLPVIFFIHGGYFSSGSSNIFRPEYFMDEDVVLVTFNYRLGALGFLSTGDSIVRGNMGLKDQSLALKWVHENIQYFGGDPKQITVYGQSSGAVSVSLMMLSPMTKGLMNKAITQSGAALNVWALNEDPASQAKHFAKELKCPVESSTEMVECLRKVETRKLLQVHREAVDPARTSDKVFVPVVEAVVDKDTFLADHPLNLMKNGQQANIPWLAGANSGDGLFLTHNVYKNATYRRLIENDWNILADSLLYLTPREKQFNQRIKEFYFGNETQLHLIKDFPNITNLVTDRAFMTGLHQSMRIQAPKSPVYFFYYTKTGSSSFFDILMQVQGKYPPLIDGIRGAGVALFKSRVLQQTSKPLLDKLGVCHADELFMLFKVTGTASICPSDSDYKFSKDFVKFYTSFASNDDENDFQFRNKKVPRLDDRSTTDLKCLEINDEPSVKTFPLLKRVTFWDTLEATG